MFRRCRGERSSSRFAPGTRKLPQEQGFFPSAKTYAPGDLGNKARPPRRENRGKPGSGYARFGFLLLVVSWGGLFLFAYLKLPESAPDEARSSLLQEPESRSRGNLGSPPE